MVRHGVRRVATAAASIAFLASASSFALGRNPAPRAPLVVLSLEFEKDLPLATFSVNGVPLRFILDTAASDCAIDEAAAARAGVRATETAWASGSGGMVRVSMVRGIRLTAPGLEIEPALSIITPLEGLRFKGPLGGILGRPLFDRYVVELDYPERVARVFEPAGFRPPAGAAAIPVFMTDGPTVRGRAKFPGLDAFEADFQVDTGSSHVLTFCQPFVDERRMLDAVPGLRPEHTTGLGGVSPDMVGTIESVGVAGFVLANPEVRFSTHASGSLATTKFQGNLGNGFLNRCVMVMDLPHARMFLRLSARS